MMTHMIAHSGHPFPPQIPIVLGHQVLKVRMEKQARDYLNTKVNRQ